jgi:predicted nucleic acid-binding protein
MRLILDASVALKWVLNEDDSDLARELRADYLAGAYEFIVPDIFPAEIGHALVRAERRGLIDVGEASLLATRILFILPDLYPNLDLISRAIDIASKHRVGVHDCVYVALAEQENIPLLTADRKLLDALRDKFPMLTLNELL